MVRKYLVTEDEFLSATVTEEGELTFTRDNGETVVAGAVVGPVGPAGPNTIPTDQAIASNLAAEGTETNTAFRLATVAARGTVVDSDHPNLEAALAATPVGGVLEVRENHSRSTNFVVDKAVTVRFVNGGSIAMTSGAGRGISVAANGVTIESPTLTGTGSATSGSGTGIYAADVSGLNIVDPQIDGWSQYGIYFSRVTDFEITGGLIHDLAYAGVMFLSCQRGFVFRTVVDTVTQPDSLPQSYGFAATKDATQPLNTHPHSTDITFKSCIARNVTKWEAFDTHAGIRIRWEDCHSYNSYHGFAVVGMEDKTVIPNQPGWAPIDFSITGCTADSGVTDGSRGSGLSIAGQSLGAGSPHAFATGKVRGMRIKGHGDATNGNQGGTYIHTTKGLVIDGITLEACAPHGLLMSHTNIDFQIDHVEVIDPWKGVGGDAPVGIAFRSSHNQGSVGVCKIWRGAKVADQVLGYGIRNWINTTDTDIRLGDYNVTGASVAPLLNPGNRMGRRLDGSVGFFGSAPILKPTVTGSRTGETAAAASQRAALVALGLITDATTA